jgi:outer membrane protein TolC
MGPAAGQHHPPSFPTTSHIAASHIAASHVTTSSAAVTFQNHSPVGSGTRDGSLDINHAVRLALENSGIVRVVDDDSVIASESTAFDPAIANNQVQAALAAFDTTLESKFYTTSINRPPNAFFGPGLTQPNQRDEAAFQFGGRKRWMPGTETSVMFNPDPTYFYRPLGSGSGFNPSYVGQLEISVRQPLLRGAGKVNRVPLQIRLVESKQSTWMRKQAIMESLSGVVNAYWQVYATQIEIAAIDEVIPLLEEVVRLQEEGYKVEWVIYADVAKAYAQLHDFRQRRLNRSSELLTREIRLRSLLGLNPDDGWRIFTSSEPIVSHVLVDRDFAFSQAYLRHPELVRQRLDTRIRELALFAAKNGLKPQFDFQALYRMNGVGEKLDSSLQQMLSAEFSDWQLGFTFSMPIGNRLASAGSRAAELQLARSQGLLQHQTLTVAHEINQKAQRIEFSFREYEEANLRHSASKDWAKGARIRYQNPQPNSGTNWLLQNLDDYLSALRFQVDAAADQASILAQYNTAIIELEEAKGTLLEYLDIQCDGDPCCQADWLPSDPRSGASRIAQSRLPAVPKSSPTEGHHDGTLQGRSQVAPTVTTDLRVAPSQPVTSSLGATIYLPARDRQNSYGSPSRIGD